MLRTSIRAAVLGAAILFAARPASAQLGISFGIDAGAAVPVQDFGNLTNTGYTLGGSLGIRPVLFPIGLRFDGAFQQFGFKDSFIGTGADVKANIWSITANGTLNLVPTGLLYAIGGVGYYSQGYSNSAYGSATNDPGVNIGAGLRIPLTGLGAHVEARYHHIFNNETNGSTSFVPITFGVTF